MPKFSVIIPCFNAEATIEATLRSLLAQTCPDWEAICIDDGSTDGTLNILRLLSQSDGRLRYVANMGKGPSAARNQGVKVHACGEIIAFCDADDLWQPTKLAELAGVFENKTVHGAYGKVGFFTKAPGDGHRFSAPGKGWLSIETLLGENPVCTMSNLSIRRSAFVASGGFAEDMVHNEDLEWLIRVVGQGAQIVSLGFLQTWYRTSAKGLSADLGRMEQGRERALATAAGFGVRPSAQSHAIHARYLARRALRTGAGRADALRLAVAGLRQSPDGFLRPYRRGGLTLLGALCATVLPRRLTSAIFS